jgi:hypothetical protein
MTLLIYNYSFVEGGLLCRLTVIPLKLFFTTPLQIGHLQKKSGVAENPLGLF